MHELLHTRLATAVKHSAMDSDSTVQCCSIICNRWHSPYMPSLFLQRTRVASPRTPSMTYQELPEPPPYKICVLALSKYTFALLACACSAWAGEARGMQQVPGSWLGHQWHHSAVTTHSLIHSLTHSLNHVSCARLTVDLAHDSGARYTNVVQKSWTPT